MKSPTLSPHMKHMAALAGAAAGVVGVAFYAPARNAAQGTDLGVDPASLGSSGLAGGGLRSLLNKLGLGDFGTSTAGSGAGGLNNTSGLPGNSPANPWEPPSDGPNLGDLGTATSGGLATQTDSSGPQGPTPNSLISSFLNS